MLLFPKIFAGIFSNNTELITYTAWAVLFSVIIFRDGSILNAGNVLCCIAVVVFGILSAMDLKELIK